MPCLVEFLTWLNNHFNVNYNYASAGCDKLSSHKMLLDIDKTCKSGQIKHKQMDAASG